MTLAGGNTCVGPARNNAPTEINSPRRGINPRRVSTPDGYQPPTEINAADRDAPPSLFPARISFVDAEARHRNCWYARRTAWLPDNIGSHTIIDGELIYCAHPLYWPVVRYEFDLRNCEECDVFKPRRTERPAGEQG